MGLLGVIRMTDPNLNMLALGADLTSLGLNLNSPKSFLLLFKLLLFIIIYYFYC